MDNNRNVSGKVYVGDTSIAADEFNKARQMPPLREFVYWDKNGRGLAAVFWAESLGRDGVPTGEDYLKTVMVDELYGIAREGSAFSDSERAMALEAIKQVPHFTGSYRDPEALRKHTEAEKALIESTREAYEKLLSKGNSYMYRPSVAHR